MSFEPVCVCGHSGNDHISYEVRRYGDIRWGILGCSLCKCKEFKDSGEAKHFGKRELPKRIIVNDLRCDHTFEYFKKEKVKCVECGLKIDNRLYEIYEDMYSPKIEYVTFKIKDLNIALKRNKLVVGVFDEDRWKNGYFTVNKKGELVIRYNPHIDPKIRDFQGFEDVVLLKGESK